MMLTKSRNISHFFGFSRLPFNLFCNYRKNLPAINNLSERELIESVKSLPLKDFSVSIHHILLQKQKSPIYWSSVEN